MTENRLAMAEGHVEEGRRIVARQRDLIARQRVLGQDTDVSEWLLSQFELSLVAFEADLQSIRDKI